MKRLALTSLLLLAACSSLPPDAFQPTTPHELVGFSIVAGRSCPIWKLEHDTVVWCGPHRIGDGPDIYDERGQDAVAVNLGDE